MQNTDGNDRGSCVSSIFFCPDDVNQHKRGKPKQQNASKSAAETAAVAVDSLVLRFHLTLLPL